MICPLCGQRKARRACPALGRQICAVCCGTKRLTEIRCPPDCVFLASAREHPPAVQLRQRQHDLSVVMHLMRDFNQRQSELFLLTSSFFVRYQSPALQPVIDDDLLEAAAALASTYETSARGVIYEHRPSSLPAERLLAGLRPVLAEAGKGGGTPFERDAAVVLRRVEESVRQLREREPENKRAFLDLLGRIVKSGDKPEEPRSDRSASQLIVP